MAAAFDSDSDDSDFSGFGTVNFREDDLDADLSDFDVSVSDVSSVELSSSGESDEEPEIERQREANNGRWNVNDRSDIPKERFSGPRPGAVPALPMESNELSFFYLFFPINLIVLLVAQTNLYAAQKITAKPDPLWYDVTIEEMKAYLGIRVYMSIVRLPAFKNYWCKDWLFGKFFIPNIMRRDRFDKIMQYFHCADSRGWFPPRGQPGHDRCYPVRTFLETVRGACRINYNPHQNCSVDEAMIAFRGRLSWRQYIPSKPTKYGIKVWMRADPTNGYCNDFQVYTGRAAGNQPEKGLGKRVVMDMMYPIRGRHHILNCDNYFTSPELFHELLEQKTYARGTVRQNRKHYPTHYFPKKDIKNRGDFKSATRGEMVACAWKDKKLTYFLSTAENPSQLDSHVPRKLRNGQIQEFTCPSTVPAYNNNMNGVDRADQLRTEYSTYRTAHKFWTYLFWFVFDVSVANAFILMKESLFHKLRTKSGKVKERTMKDFRQNLAKQLIGTHRAKKRKVLAPLDPVSNLGHYPRKGKKGRCKMCSKLKKRSESCIMCIACNVHLCIDCFEMWHNYL